MNQCRLIILIKRELKQLLPSGCQQYFGDVLKRMVPIKNARDRKNVQLI